MHFGRNTKWITSTEKNRYVNNNQWDEYGKTHLINVNLMRQDKFDEVFTNRVKELIKISEAMGKPMTNLSGEDVIEAFGASLEWNPINKLEKIISGWNILYQ